MSSSFNRCQKAIDRSMPEELRMIIQGGNLDMREVEAHGRTLLMFAVAPVEPASVSASLEIVRILLEAGADPNQKDNEGWSAVHIAARDDTEMLRILLEAGGNPHAPDPYGNNPISIATFAGRKDNSRIKLLMAARADPTVKNKYGNSALDIARKMSAHELVELLEGAK